jgi:hypothetical protein
VLDYKEELRGFKERLQQGHRVKLMLDRIQQSSEKLVSVIVVRFHYFLYHCFS